ncbi:MAG: LuxR C-terminal-related transcriptional regulator, partial [Alteraurantiacibacter sp. bin_em_oilr2.035]|nr:LuxR C-terminal-related transcriptional regulator [Alteraurantiacibacter sp. bin_em_oilr2.035]
HKAENSNCEWSKIQVAEHMSQIQNKHHPLTSKQAEVVVLLSEGRTGREIASTLQISQSAVSQRIETLRAKFVHVSRLGCSALNC